MTSCMRSSRAFENPPVLIAVVTPSRREVGDSAASAMGATLRLLPVLLPAERGLVEVVVGAAGILGAARIRRVGVEDPIAVTQKTALARLLAGLSFEKTGRSRRLVFGFAAVVVFHRSDRLVERHVEV